MLAAELLVFIGAGAAFIAPAAIIATVIIALWGDKIIDIMEGSK